MSTVLLYGVLRYHFAHEDQAFLADKIHLLREPLAHAADIPTALYTEVIAEAAERRYARIYIRVLAADGRTLIETPGMESEVRHLTFPPPCSSDEDPAWSAEMPGDHERILHIASATALLADRTQATIQIAYANPQERALLAQFRLWIIAVLALAGLILVVISHRLTRRGLRPLDDVASAASGIGSTNLDRRLVVDGLPAELKTMADSFNAMLDRIEEAFTRLSQFSDDLAHELRTPINNLRGEAEVALGHTRSVAEYQDVLASCLEECQKIGQLIDSLLFLARAENPRSAVARETIDLSHELQAVATFYRTAAEDVGVTLTSDLAAGLSMRGDVSLMQRAIGNLVENAIDHTPSGGRVRIDASASRGAMRVIISDTGSGIPSEHLPYVFERFHRVERARSNARGHVGLGLPIVRSIIVMHGGTVEITSVIGEGTRVSIQIPIQPDQAPDMPAVGST